MCHLLQIDDRRESVQLLEDMIRARILCHLRHRPVFIGGVAEDDCARGTRGGTRGGELVRLQGALFQSRTILGFTNSLHAETALLHHALSTHRDIGIELPVQWLGEGVLRPGRLTITEPVEVANLVGAVIGAVTRADAAVVNLYVQPVWRVIRRVHRAHRLARSVAAVLTHHRHETGIEIGAAVFPALVVSLDANPRHLAAAQEIGAKSGPIRQEGWHLPIRSYRWDVVLGVAGAHAGSASSAARKVDGHRPTALGHSTPVIRGVHALVLGVWIALLTLGIVGDRRPESRKELVRRVARHFFAVCSPALGAVGFRTAHLGYLGSVGISGIVAWTARFQIGDGDRLTDSSAVLPG